MREGAADRQGRPPRSTTSSAKHSPASQSGYRSESDDESDWDFGVGNLVIDLEADIEKTKASNNNNTLSSNNNLPRNAASASPAKANKMSSVEHQATVDNKAGIKMKIKRKNPSAKSSEAKHEIIKSEKGANSPGDSSPVDRAKNSQTSEKDKSKGRTVHGKKVKDRNKGANSNSEQVNGSNTAFMMSPAPQNNNTNPATNNVNLAQVGSVSVELDRLATPYPPATTPQKKDVEDPYEFNVNKVEDRPLGFPVKKIKVEKVSC